MSQPPTDRQRLVLRFVHDGQTQREISASIGSRSSGAARDHLVALIRKGLLDGAKDPGRPGRYVLTDAGLAALGLQRCECCAGNGTVPRKD